MSFIISWQDGKLRGMCRVPAIYNLLECEWMNAVRCSHLSKSCSCGGSMVILEEGEDVSYCRDEDRAVTIRNRKRCASADCPEPRYRPLIHAI
jgi:hypothetical protein